MVESQHAHVAHAAVLRSRRPRKFALLALLALNIDDAVLSVRVLLLVVLHVVVGESTGTRATCLVVDVKASGCEGVGNDHVHTSDSRVGHVLSNALDFVADEAELVAGCTLPLR